MKTIRPRKFVATAAAIGAGAILRAPLLALEVHCRLKACGPRRDYAASDSISHEWCATPAESFWRRGRGESKIL